MLFEAASNFVDATVVPNFAPKTIVVHANLHEPGAGAHAISMPSGRLEGIPSFFPLMARCVLDID